MSRCRSLAGLVVACAAALLVGALASAPVSANFVASAPDAPGDAADGIPGRDIVRVALQYDRRTGSMKGGVLLAGDPVPTPANLTLFAGSTTAGGCNGYPAVGFGTLTDKRSADWVRLPGAGVAPIRGSAAKSYDGAAEDYETFDNAALRGVRPDCVIAQLNSPEDPAVVYDVAGPFALRALPELTSAFTRERFLRRGEPYRFVVTVRNVGDAPSGRLRLETVPRRGLKVRLPKTVRSIPPGGKRKVAIVATAGRRTPDSFDMTVTATGAGGVRTTAEEFTIVTDRRPPPADGGGGGGGADDSPRLCYRYTWLPPYGELRPC